MSRAEYFPPSVSFGSAAVKRKHMNKAKHANFKIAENILNSSLRGILKHTNYNNSDSLKEIDTPKNSKKSVQFHEFVKVILIPCREEFRAIGIVDELWWTEANYCCFQREARAEITLYANLESLDFVYSRNKLYQPRLPLLDALDADRHVDYEVLFMESCSSSSRNNSQDYYFIGSSIGDDEDETTGSPGGSSVSNHRGSLTHSSSSSPSRPSLSRHASSSTLSSSLDTDSSTVDLAADSSSSSSRGTPDDASPPHPSAATTSSSPPPRNAEQDLLISSPTLEILTIRLCTPLSSTFPVPSLWSSSRTQGWSRPSSYLPKVNLIYSAIALTTAAALFVAIQFTE